ncbi:MAG: dihydrofolate reductase [Paracoccaceae bacterium]|jgi:dihydrofolate reductase
MISLIVARARGGAIGKGNTIPWYAPEDLAFFKRETLGGAIIMGRNTWDSLPFKPLKGRLNIVVTTKGCDADVQFPTLEQALEAAHAQGYRRIYGVGGHGIYKALLPLADRLVVTEVGLDIEGADTFFPSFDPAQWRRVGTTDLRASDPSCTVHEYLRA